MPPGGSFCRDLQAGKIIRFCRKSGLTRQFAALNGSQMVVENREVYYRVR